MAKLPKVWTALGVAALGGSVSSAHAMEILLANSGIILIQEAGEGGEGGGEGGNSGIATYALNSTSPDDFNYQADLQIDAYLELVHDAYQRSRVGAANLETAIATLLSDPSETTLKAARQAWLAARPAYLKTEAFRFYDGPIEELEGEINAWPLNEAAIDYVDGNRNAGLINDPNIALTIDSLTDLNQKNDEADVTTGWHAIEFLLWGQDQSTASPGRRPFGDYVAGQGNNDRRREYLTLVAAKLTQDLQSVADAWRDGGGETYAETLESLPEREVIGRMLNGMAILAGFEFMSERLAVALDSGDQEDEHSCFSDNTKNDFLFDLQGIQQVWSGDSDGATRAGLDDLVRAQNPGLAERVDRLLADAAVKILALGDPWDSVLATPQGSPERAAAEELVVALQDLAAGLTDVGTQLGVLVLVP